MDVCGVKAEIVKELHPAAQAAGIRYVGTHPMAGSEFSGFAHASAHLFDRASFIVTPIDETHPQALETVVSLATSMGFARIVTSTPQEHDRIIAFTSQLAHVVSSAYIKSSTLPKQSGFSAGSFQDLTRVAKLNEDMWTSLFFFNRQPLLEELSELIGHLEEFKTALQNEDREGMRSLLRDGRIRKEQSSRS